MKIFLAVFIIFAIALPAIALGEGFDKAWADASPGWYARITVRTAYIYGSHPEIYPIEYGIAGEQVDESLSFISGDIDQRSKPIFQRISSIPQYYVPNCFDDTLIFRVSGEDEDIEVHPGGIHFNPEVEPPFEYWFASCRKIIHWELLRKSCGEENFAACIADKFSEKFPFDLLFNLPSTEISCPRVNFFGAEFDLCFIYEAMRMIKYPIAAALIIKLFLYL